MAGPAFRRSTTGRRFGPSAVASRAAEWLALQPGAHEGYVDWERAEAIRKMVSENVPTAGTVARPSTVPRCSRACCVAAAAAAS